MNLALRAVHDGLRVGGNPAPRWRALMVALDDRVDLSGTMDANRLQCAAHSLGVCIPAAEWMVHLRWLGVVDAEGRFDRNRADCVGTALDLVADSFDPVGSTVFWAPVATLPTELQAKLRPPPLRQTAGVLLELADRAGVKIRLAAPFIDPPAVGFVADALIGAGRRGVELTVLTSAGQGVLFQGFARRWRAEAVGALRVAEVQTDLSALGSHAKVLVVDDARGYVGSANLTAAGLGRHIEVGVEVAGPQVAELTRLLVALERLGSLVPDCCADRRS